jgi:hypothetical protein
MAWASLPSRNSRELEDWKGASWEIIRRRSPWDRSAARWFFASAYRALERAGCDRYVVVGHSLGGGLPPRLGGRDRCQWA